MRLLIGDYNYSPTLKKNLQILFVQIVLLLGSTFSHLASAQTIYKATNSAGAVIKLSGTSTLHDWDMNAKAFKAEGEFKLNTANQLQSLTGLVFSMQAENLKGDKKKMDERAYEALSTDKYKEISFKMSTAGIKFIQSNKYNVTVAGNLTIAGVTKIISLNANCILNADKTITCTGSQKIKLTDFHIDPPSFLGFMKVGNEVTLDFTILFKS